MIKAFRFGKEHPYFKSVEEYNDKVEKQKEQVFGFLEEKGIEAHQYYLGGSGFLNQPFIPENKKAIGLGIVPTEKDLKQWNNILGKAQRSQLRYLKKNSQIMRDFQEFCIDEQVIINLSGPSPRDYFKQLGYAELSYHLIPAGDYMYLKIDSVELKDEIPEGMEEIKLREFYRVWEDRR